jgi:peptidyl-prolyl cis-trans isomerase B (cyclophilin B)
MKIRVCLAVSTLALAVPFAVSAQVSTPECDAALATDAPKVKLTTTMGPIVLTLDKKKAPLSTANFVRYVGAGHYDGTVFHRVIDNFMIQGGGMDKDMREKPTRAPVKNESTNGLKNEAYSVAMARTSDPDSGTSQFFINVKDNEFLNNTGPGTGYTVFGKVTSGKETVDKLRKVRVEQTRYSEATPLEQVSITKAECVK